MPLTSIRAVLECENHDFSTCAQIFFPLETYLKVLTRERRQGSRFRSAQAGISLPAASLAVVALFAFINSWNEFFNPLIYLSTPGKDTLQVGLFIFFGLHVVNWPGFMAAAVILAPVALIFILAQRFFIEGITFTGLRG